MGAATFNADVGLVAVCFCVSVLLTSCTLDGVRFIEVRRFCLYNSVLKPRYFIIFFVLFLVLQRIGSVVLGGFVTDIDISSSVS
jgi:hypothetical protein